VRAWGDHAREAGSEASGRAGEEGGWAAPERRATHRAGRSVPRLAAAARSLACEDHRHVAVPGVAGAAAAQRRSLVAAAGLDASIAAAAATAPAIVWLLPAAGAAASEAPLPRRRPRRGTPRVGPRVGGERRRGAAQRRPGDRARREVRGTPVL
jgi:hypothetical protein